MKIDRRAALTAGLLSTGSIMATGLKGIPNEDLSTIELKGMIDASILNDEKQDENQGQVDPADRDKEFVLSAGMTEAEAECWKITAQAAGAFFDLPEQHPMDKQEVASAIHIIQNKLLSRPTYRKYLENAKAAAGE